MAHPWPARPSTMVAAWGTAITSSRRRSVCRPAGLWRPAVSPSSPAPAEVFSSSGRLMPCRGSVFSSTMGAARATATSSTRRRSAKSTAASPVKRMKSCCAPPTDQSAGHRAAGGPAPAPAWCPMAGSNKNQIVAS
uniref:(northern house mosquito) hypothetical protein n=1 Tax=Culex pipiens TaxID=7175 RepID=A0A8D8NQH6_CULPI